MSDDSANAMATLLDPALLDGLIDYAGIFPPAQLALADAIAEYAALRDGPHRALVGPFLVRSSLLDALDRDSAPGDWPIGVVADEPIPTVVERVAGSARRIVQVELPLRDGDDRLAIADALAMLPRTVDVYVEAAGGAPIIEQVAHVAALRSVNAKLRTGGVQPGSTAPADVLADFMIACRQLGLRWKVTAGLHQPLRHFEPSVGEEQHGFLNVLAAAWLVERAASRDAVLAALRGEAVGDLVLPPPAVRERMRSFGSCSVAEPVDGLTALGLLPRGQPVDPARAWVVVASSTDLPAGGTLAVEAHGEKLVAYRTASGEVHVLGRFCGHLGANLARLGRVHGDTLHCSSHHWAYGPDGRCIDAPGEATLPDACLTVREVREIDGRIEVAGRASTEGVKHAP